MKKKESKRVKEIRTFANTGIELCKKSLTKSIIDLCRETGIDSSVDIQFTQLVLLHSTKPEMYKGRFYGFETRTTICDRISWGEHHEFFMVALSGRYLRSSWEMTLDELTCIYSEMLNVIKKLQNSES